MVAIPSTLIFGPQTSPLSADTLFQLRASLLLDPRLHTIRSALDDLPSLWSILVDADPNLDRVNGRYHLEQFSRWLTHGDLLDTSSLPSIITTPLTVVLHIVQLFSYVGGASPDTPSYNEMLDGVKTRGGIQGFCTGLLTALAVASSIDEESLGDAAARCLRLAACIGAYIDFEAGFTCLAVKWRSDQTGKERLQTTLDEFPEAYISVQSEPNGLSVIAPAQEIDQLSRKLAGQGFITKPVGVNGRFHSPKNSEAAQRLIKLCDSHPNLQLASASELLVPVFSNHNGTSLLIKPRPLHEIAIESILVQLCDWNAVLTKASAHLLPTESTVVVQFGQVDCIPAAILRNTNASIVKPAVLSPAVGSSLGSPLMDVPSNSGLGKASDNAVAVVGMACKFPGADSIDEFWDLISAGSSMCRQMPEERFQLNGLRRSDEKLKFWGNFVDNVDAFDHKFFKKSSREAASMDPQQRLLLQVAYQALESTEYFAPGSSSSSHDIGCYLGVCSTDYNDNVASNAPNAYSSLGTLRAFLSGKISHFFGWTGPSITYDTACSSSAVAIHAACKAIQSGECSMALAGGASLYTSPYFYENLAAASFLSPTGPTKPFDSRGDGYCRGEGIGIVVLKRLADAQAAGDHIMGVVAATAINQNENSTAITVPHSGSQIQLYEKVALDAGIDPRDVSFVEAHGTGTPVGDPIEFSSIRNVFGGPQRARPLHVASVKGNIGHLEGASGVAALIKTILMMEHETIPVQANYSQLNPKIAPLEPDHIIIPKSNQPWNVPFKAACINNYGAAGSNAAMMVCSPPAPRASPGRTEAALQKYPLYISANSASSLRAYCRALELATQKLAHQSDDGSDVASVLFNLAQRQNRALPHAMMTSISTLPELQAVLAAGSAGSSQLVTETPIKEGPTVFVFGGQTSSFVGLSKAVFEASELLQSHLRACDVVIQASGCPSIFPAIFQTEPIDDTVLLHALFFAIQYACAMAWIDSGLVPAAVLGHSFGQLTALCVSGSLSLKDGIKLVTGRARLMQTSWGSDRGAMIAVQADAQTVQRIISTSSTTDPVEVACFNGPTSHVLVGTATAIDAVEKLLQDGTQGLAGVKRKRLAVTHGFHSRFTESLLPGLTELAQSLQFTDPVIPLETCSDGSTWTKPNAALIAQHTRTPVYFGQAVERLADRLGTCTWIEVGSGSGVTGMVRAALPAPSSHVFQAIQLQGENAVGGLTDATVNLWKAGHSRVQFWPFHRGQRSSYSSFHLPPYQFETTRHWLEWKDTATNVETAKALPASESQEPVFLALAGYHDSNKLKAEFHVDTRSREYQFFVKGHAVLAQPLCPAPLYVELAGQAAMMIQENSSDWIPSVTNLDIQAPLGAKETIISIALERTDSATPSWNFVFSNSSEGSSSVTRHASGTVTLQQESSHIAEEAARYEKLVGSRRYRGIVADPKAEALQGGLVYRVFGKVVTYADYYKGVQCVFGRDEEVAGQVQLPDTPTAVKDCLLNPLAVDNFIQVSGLHVNSLTEIRDNEVYVCTKVDRVQPSTKFLNHRGSGSWLVYSTYHHIGERELVNDIFVFDAATNALVFWVLGARFTRVVISSLARVLSRANNDKSDTSVKTPPPAQTAPIFKPEKVIEHVPTRKILSELQAVLNVVTEVPTSDITEAVALEDLGVDSLMGSEVLTEINKAFKVSIPMEEFALMTDVFSIVQALQTGLGIVSDGSSSSETDSELGTPTSGATTPLSQPDIGLDTVHKLASLLGTALETTDSIESNTNLADLGLDSLLSIELASDIKKQFGADVDMTQITMDSTFGDLASLVLGNTGMRLHMDPSAVDVLQKSLEAANTSSVTTESSISGAQQAFEDIRFDYDIYTQETGFAGFWKKVYPTQSRLVLAYTVEAFAKLGCDLSSLKPGEHLTPIEYLPKHQKLVDQLYNILRDGLLVATDGKALVRSDQPIDATPSTALFSRILTNSPQHISEHKLLNITGSKLAECLTGEANPLDLLFRSKENKDLLVDVYAKGPMYEAISKLLCSFLGKAFSKGETVQILELGGGTGGTTRYVIDCLSQLGIPFEYTFTDLSGSLVVSARKAFAGRSNMSFQIVDIEKEPTEKLRGKFHAIISTNCIHATRNLEVSTRHMQQMLRPGGFVSLVEFTRNMFWFDLVFGLLDGWWFFEDGREHVLASEHFWDASMRRAGFEHVTWTDGESLEARTLRIMTGFNAAPQNSQFVPQNTGFDAETAMETVQYKQVDSTSLFADVYFPSIVSDTPRPIALMIHGGGHIMLSRKDIRPKQTAHLLSLGFLPISVDYRLCPETTLPDGPMADVCDALIWAREKLPSIQLRCSGLTLDPSRVAVVGWSTGGHLAMTTSFTSIQRKIAPPVAILAFYCPTDYEDSCWVTPNFPENTTETSTTEFDLLEGVRENAITGYNVDRSLAAVGGWMSPKDPRSRIVLHMNWKGQFFPVLLRGLPASSKVSTSEAEALVSQPQPDAREIQQISPYAQILQGNYRTPTFVIHGTEDDLIPFAQSVRTVDALKAKGIAAEVAIVDGKVHLFDLYRDVDGKGWEAVCQGYEFLSRQVFN